MFNENLEKYNFSFLKFENPKKEIKIPIQIKDIPKEIIQNENQKIKEEIHPQQINNINALKKNENNKVNINNNLENTSKIKNLNAITNKKIPEIIQPIAIQNPEIKHNNNIIIPESINENKNKQINKEPQEEKIIVKTNIPEIQKMQIACDNYFNIREKLKKISSDKNFKSISNKISIEINVPISQIIEANDAEKNARIISNILLQLKAKKNLELFLFTIDLTFKLLLKRSENYKSEAKKIYLNFAVFILELNSNIGDEIIKDFFISIIMFKCPYLAFKEFKKSDFSDIKLFRKRQGFASENESMSDWLKNIEAYSYLFFSYIYTNLNFCGKNSNKKNKNQMEKMKNYLEDFLKFYENCEKEKINYPIMVIFKVFLNTLGKEILRIFSFSDGNEKLMKIAKKISVVMEEKKKKSEVSGEMKSIILENLHFIKVYVKQIKEKKLTDMFTN